MYTHIVGELANAWGDVLFPVQNELKWYIVNDLLFSMAEINMTVCGICYNSDIINYTINNLSHLISNLLCCRRY